MHTTYQPRALRMNLHEAEQAQIACTIKYKKDKTNADELRKEFEKKVNAKRAVKYKTSVETQQKITKNALDSKRTHSRIRKVMNKKPRTAITYGEYTGKNGCEQECTTTAEIIDACINKGYKRYTQAHGSPFLTGPLLEDLGFLGNQNKVQDILNGMYDCPKEVDEFTKTKYLRTLTARNGQQTRNYHWLHNDGRTHQKLEKDASGNSLQHLWTIIFINHRRHGKCGNHRNRRSHCFHPSTHRILSKKMARDNRGDDPPKSGLKTRRKIAHHCTIPLTFQYAK
jgi:hypothetical protein